MFPVLAVLLQYSGTFAIPVVVELRRQRRVRLSPSSQDGRSRSLGGVGPMEWEWFRGWCGAGSTCDMGRHIRT